MLGFPATVLDRLADYKERTAAMRGRVATAMIYPCIVLVVAVGVSVLLMTFVVPKLLGPLLDLAMLAVVVLNLRSRARRALALRGFAWLHALLVLLLALSSTVRAEPVQEGLPLSAWVGMLRHPNPNQRERAVKSEAKTRAVIREFLVKVTESQLLTVPGLQPLRRELLTAAGSLGVR